MTTSLRRLGAGILVALASAGCAVWRSHPVPAPVARTTALETAAVRVTQVGGTQRVLRRPVVVGDSLAGREGAVALRDVQRLEVRRVSPGRTAAAVVGGAALAAALAAVVLWGAAMSGG